MNITQIPTGLCFLRSVGMHLSEEKCVLAAASLREARARLRLRDIYLWGKIWGGNNNYYVAFGYKSDILSARYHLYSIDCLEWQPLPLTTRRQREMALLATETFSGKPDRVIRVTPQDEEMAGEAAGAGDVDVNEVERIGTIVALVNHEAAVVPRGALVKRFDGPVIPNDAFKGLAWEDATSLRNYMHFRPPVRTLAANLRDRPNHELEYDFMDPVTVDVVQSHALRLEKMDRVAVVRSMCWPGLVAFHRVATPDWGFLYVGTGIRLKLDLPFLLPATTAPPPMQRRRAPPPAPPATPATDRPPSPSAAAAAAVAAGGGAPAAADSPAPVGAAAAARRRRCPTPPGAAAAAAAAGSPAAAGSAAAAAAAPTTGPAAAAAAARRVRLPPDLEPRRSPSLVPLPYPRYDDSASSTPGE